MAGTKTEYPALLAALQPTQAVGVLNNRVRQIHKINEDVSDWLAERRKIEEAYVAGLNRLAARRYDAGAELGVFQTPWQSIISGTIALAEAHSGFASRIMSDVESPLKDQRRDLQSMNSLQSNLASMAKDVDKSQKKSASSASEAMSQWESQAPYVFEQLQSLDENRVGQMRDALTQLQTHEIDCHERSKSSAESALDALLNVDTPEEVSAFVARTSSEVPPAATAPESSRPDTSGRARAQTSRSERDMTGSVLAPPATRQETDDRRSELSGQSDDAPKEKKSRLSGLRRLGTVMSRRKDKEKLDEKTTKPKRRNPLRRGSSSAGNQPIPSPNGSTPELPNTNLNTRRTSAALEERPTIMEEPEVPAAAAPVAAAAAAAPAESTAIVDTDSTVQPREAPTTNGQLTTGTVPQIGIRPPSTIVEEGAAGSVLADIERAQQEANAQESENAFNLNIRDKPIHEESRDEQAAAMANVSSALRASVVPPPARRSGTLRGRRDVRNTVFVPNTTPENATASSLNTSAAAPAAASAATTDPVPTGSTTVSPIVGSGISPIIPSESRAADMQSIRSSHSVASSVGPGAVKHPDMAGPGLNASIVETSSATFTNGVASKAVVIGEMAMVHNGAINGTSAPHVRLDNFQVLEKVAPNPAFVSQIANKSGEYNVDLSQLSKTSVAFKYQVHLNDSSLGAYAPIMLTPRHKIEPNQTSVILNYALNPAFAAAVAGGNSGSGKSVTLQNVVVVLTLEGAKVTGCQSEGFFNREKSLVYWKLDNLKLDPTAPATSNRLLARFATDGPAKGASVEARWELRAAGSGLGLSVLGGDPFADAGASSSSLASAKEVDVVRKLVGGRYVATSEG